MRVAGARIRPRSLVVLPALAIGLGSVACGDDDQVQPTVTQVEPKVSEPTLVVPGAGLPPDVVPQAANNNLDVVRHDGRIFLAFRSAKSHFAGPEAELWVVSTEDEETFRFEGHFAFGTDVREPRFLSLNGELHLYFGLLGTSRLTFEPKGAKVTHYSGPGQWSEPEDIFEVGFIPWRTKIVGGKAYLVGYTGGGAIYDFGDDGGTGGAAGNGGDGNGGRGDGGGGGGGDAGQGGGGGGDAPIPSQVDVYFLTTTDGRTFSPVVEGKPIVHTGGASETDFELLDDGSLVAVMRNELGDPSGWGSKICRAPKDALATWTCKNDPKKYDSPLVFRHGGDVWLIARRNVTADGNYDLGMRDLSQDEQTSTYLVDYSFKPKRCSLWKVDPDAQAVSFQLDFASKGDTCFPGVVPVDPKAGTFEVYNYSNPLDFDDDIAWLQGQGQPTNIYRQLLSLGPPR